MNNLKDRIYESKTIAEIWGKGYIEIGEVNSQTVSYTARYAIKKLKERYNDDYYIKNHLEKEFSVMSRKPGIGQKYFQENKEEIYKNDEIIIKEKNDKVTARKPPKYFDRLLEKENEQLIEKIKAKRRIGAMQGRAIELQGTTKGEVEYLQQKEETTIEKINNLQKIKKICQI